MAKQERQRGKSGTDRKVATVSVASKKSDEGETLAGLRRERNALRTKLAAAEARISELEDRQKTALDRIDWVLDSLATLAETDPSGRNHGAPGSRN